MRTSINIPMSRLSHSAHRRHAQLRNYFCDKDAIATLVGDLWELRLEWSNDPYRYVDPRLSEGLSWWSKDLRYEHIAISRKRMGRILLSLNDTWTLSSWCEWLSRRSGNCDVIILHVDDHKDLDAPRIFLSSDGWVDPINKAAIDLADSGSVVSAIESGAISMGSFLTPFLHYVPHADVRHLCQGPKCTGTLDSNIKLETVPDSLLDFNAVRPSVKLEATTLQKPDTKGVSRHRYRFTDNLDAWLEGLNKQINDNDTALLLHIDMDYFCNRYDGDSDALEYPRPLNPPLFQILTQIDEFTEALRCRSLLKCFDDIVIALSPGFFPAEFWAPCCERLLEGLGET